VLSWLVVPLAHCAYSPRLRRRSRIRHLRGAPPPGQRQALFVCATCLFHAPCSFPSPQIDLPPVCSCVHAVQCHC
jgi:hypothetical protein